VIAEITGDIVTATPPTNDSLGKKTTDSTVTTIYPSKYFNTDGTAPTKHIFADGNEVATITDTGASAVVRYAHTDQLTGSNIITNATGTIDETLDYYPFGGIRIDSGSYSDQRKFIGQEYDEDTGLNYLNARYYNSNIGQFVSEDPSFLTVSYNLAEPQSSNSYSYANNNPINLLDSTGNSARTFWNGVVTGSVAGFVTAAVVTAVIATAPASVPLIVAGGLMATVYAGSQAVHTYKDYKSGQISRDQFDNYAGNIAGGIVGAGFGAEWVTTPSRLSDDALVVRGGGLSNQSAGRIDEAINNSVAKGGQGFSVQCSNTCTDISQIGRLGKFLPNSETKAGTFRAAGGDVIKTPGLGEHASVIDVNGSKASQIPWQVVKNPNPLKK
jgi:RHS repeat-associated protein